MKWRMDNRFFAQVVSGNVKKVEQAISDDPAIVNWSDENGYIALHMAAEEGLLDMVNFLLSKGANPNAVNNEGFTPLHVATQPAVIKTLIDAGAQINARAYNGVTPLLYQAEENDRLDEMKALLERGADADIKDRMGRTALDIAVSYNDADRIALLKRNGAA